MSCTDNSIKIAILKGMVQSCGLSVSGKSIIKLRIILKSLRQCKLPLCPKSTIDELTIVYAIKSGGDGLRSPQQRSFRLLALMDPTLEEAIGAKRQQVKTGDFEWCDAKRQPLWQMIREGLDKWVRMRPPWGYNERQAKDMWFWETLRNAGLTWANSEDAVDFAVFIYKIYAGAFSKAIVNSDRITINKCIESFFFQRRTDEKTVIRKETARRLTNILTEDVVIVTQGRHVLDSFSFVVTELIRVVFKFFKSQVRVRVGPTTSRRFKDREDLAKTYYLGGCVYHSVEDIIKRRKGKNQDNADRQLLCLRGFCVDADTAAQHGLPTRHVCMKTGGGLVYASKAYYQVFSKMEDFFYCTVSPSYTPSHVSPPY